MAVQDFEGTRVDEISDGIFRISTAVASIAGGGVTYNQYLLVDEEPLLFHAGKRRMFSQVHEAVAHVLPLERLRWISFSHFEADDAVRLISSSPPLRTQSRYAVACSRCCRSTISPIVRPAPLAMARSCKPANSECSGSTRRIYHMAGKRA
jgi:flavorubredoxin